MSIAVYSAVIICLLLFPAQTALSAREALRVWGLEVMPSLFPYMVFCRLLAQKLKTASSSSVPIAALLGMLGGSPSGAAAVSAFGSGISQEVLLPLCALTGTISPMFLLGSMQAVTQDALLCRQLLVAHLFGAVFSCACVWIFIRILAPSFPRSQSASMHSGSNQALSQSIDAALHIGGCIICYSVIASLMKQLPFAGKSLGAVIHAILEISGGMHALCSLLWPAPLKAICMAAASSFTGVSILSQNHLFLSPLGVRMQHLISFALLRALGAGLCMALLQCL